MPQVVFHAGVVAYNCVYEYLKDVGVKKTKRKESSNGDPGTLCSSSGFRSRYKLGPTGKSEREFDQWVYEKMLTSFGKDKYNSATNNCIDFALESCQFLEVDSPNEWLEMRRKARN